MPNNPFIFFEMDFDAELFKNYFGVDIDSPGIYAIPEDGVGGQEISDTHQSNNQHITNSNDNQEINPNDSNTQLTQGQIPPIELTPEEQQQFDKDVEPLKKVFLLNKLYELSYLFFHIKLINIITHFKTFYRLMCIIFRINLIRVIVTKQ